MRTVLHVGPSKTRGGMGAVIQLLAANPPKGWNAEMMPSHADGGVVPVLRAWWKVRKDLVARLERGMSMLCIFMQQHAGHGNAKWASSKFHKMPMCQSFYRSILVILTDIAKKEGLKYIGFVQAFIRSF